MPTKQSLLALGLGLSAILGACTVDRVGPDEDTSGKQDGVIVRPRCGDGVCQQGESCSTCPGDCGECVGGCGDGVCDSAREESCLTCADDCGSCGVPHCGDGVCDSARGESCSTCTADCGSCGGPRCGDGICDAAREESCQTCATDCACPPHPPTCGDGVCEGTETCSNCAQDCGPCQPVCGDGVCEGAETCSNCAKDCGACAPCADGYQTQDCGGDIPGCNGHDGSDEAACLAEGNPGGCSEEVLIAWCNRRVDSDPTRWDQLHHDWVAERCGGPISLDVNTFWCADTTSCTRYECTTPLVLVFDGAPVRYLESGGAAFDLSAAQDGSATSTDWPSAATPWLAIDRDGDGRIADGRELFGSATRVRGGVARDGFEALAALDENGDGVVDAADPQFSRLVVWADADGDRVSSAAEMRSLGELGVLALEVAHRVELRCDARGNCERERGRFSYRDWSGAVREGAVVDVHLAVRPLCGR